MKKDTYIFPAIFDYADDGISIEFPDLEGCLSCADTDEEALYMAKDVLKGYLLVLEEEKSSIPEPTPLNQVKTEENQKAVLIEVCLAFVREPYRNQAVKKTLTIPYWLNDLAVKERVNFSSVLQSALKDYLHVNR